MKWYSTLQIVSAAFLFSVLLNDHSVQAKVALESFTQDQQDWLWGKVDEYARSEAIFQICDVNTNFEQRIVAAVQRCATPDSLGRVRAVFRRKVTSYKSVYKPIYQPADKPELCTNSGIRALFAQVLKGMDSAVEDVQNACNSCLAC
jgi:hypothetical protein